MAERESVTDAELEVLKLLWNDEPLTVREITSALYGQPTTSSIGTVQKLLQRLERKRCVRRDRTEYAHRFFAEVTQSSVAGKELEVLAEKVSDGSLAPFITHLVRAQRLSDADKESIRRLLED